MRHLLSEGISIQFYLKSQLINIDRRDWDRYICGSRSTLGDEGVAVEDMVLKDQWIPPSNEVWSRYLVKF